MNEPEITPPSNSNHFPDGTSNRSEEHLAIALWNASREGRFPLLPNGHRLQVVEYQMPLAAHKTQAVGKVDLVALIGEELCVIELKADAATHRPDPPERAMLQGVGYCAAVEANRTEIASEIERLFGVRLKDEPLRLIVLAPPSYWAAHRPAPNLLRYAERIRAASGVAVSFLALADCQVIVGGDGRPSVLTGHCLLSHPDELISELSEPTPGNMEAYSRQLTRTLRRYVEDRFGCQPGIMAPPAKGSTVSAYLARPEDNIVLPADACEAVAAEIRAGIPVTKRHKDFANFRSSQALTQAVFGSLAAMNALDALEGLTAEDGRPAFFANAADITLALERDVVSLGEPHPTQVDVLFDETRRVAVECKLQEHEFGRCSRPVLPAADPRHCDGSYRRQRGRDARCSLTQQRITYWHHLPRLFVWDAETDHTPCPLAPAYQIARNILAACVRDDGTAAPEAHALVVYDRRNPAFAPGGKADAQFWAAVRELRDPGYLRRLSWQGLLAHLREDDRIRPFADEIIAKYGFREALCASTTEDCSTSARTGPAPPIR